jgi:hypothetical protein
MLPLPISASELLTFQEIPPIPPCLQGSSDNDCDETLSTSTSSPQISSPQISSPQISSIAVLKQRMKCLRNTDLALLYQLKALHEQILSYKVVMNEGLERDSETISEFSESSTEEYDDELFGEGEQGEEMKEEEESDIPNQLQTLALIIEDGAVGGNTSRSIARSSPPQSLKLKLCQQLPPPPPKPSLGQIENSVVHSWLDRNFKSD